MAASKYLVCEIEDGDAIATVNGTGRDLAAEALGIPAKHLKLVEVHTVEGNRIAMTWTDDNAPAPVTEEAPRPKRAKAK